MENTSRKRQLIHGSNMAIFLVVLLIIVGIVNYLANAHPYRFDLTEFKDNSLSEQTIKILGNLDKPIKIWAFYKDNDPDATYLQTLLKVYRYHSDQIDFEIVDPDQSSSLAEKYGVNSYQTILVTQGDRRERAPYVSEEKITNAILKVTREKNKHVYFMKGHGEKELNDLEQNGYAEVKKTILNDDYEVSEISLANESDVPEDCSVLVMAGGFSDLFENEYQMIGEYMDRGGRLMLLIDPGPFDTFLHEMLIDWGLQIDNTHVIDPTARMRGTDFFVPIIDTYNPTHVITKDFNFYTVFPLARSFSKMEFGNDNVSLANLVQSGPNSWGETSPDSAQYNEDTDHKGPLSLAVAMEKKLVAPSQADTVLSTARIVVIGDSDFANNVYFYQQGNSDFFMNCLAWLAGEEDLISIRPKEAHERRLSMTVGQASMLFWISVIFIPLGVLVVGGVVWWMRR